MLGTDTRASMLDQVSCDANERADAKCCETAKLKIGEYGKTSVLNCKSYLQCDAQLHFKNYIYFAKHGLSCVSTGGQSHVKRQVCIAPGQHVHHMYIADTVCNMNKTQCHPAVLIRAKDLSCQIGPI